MWRKNLTRFLVITAVLTVFTGFGGCGKNGEDELIETGSTVNTRVQENENPDGTGSAVREGFCFDVPEQYQEDALVTEHTGDNVFTDPAFVVPKEGTRPVAVMIDNEGTRPLPQGGIDEAQVVYEAVVEYGVITRIMAVFWNVDPPMIGPVRSSRHYFLDYSMEHDAIYVHVGWSPMAERDIGKYGINNANGVSNGGWIFFDITDDPYNWQDTYTTMDNIMRYSDSAGYSMGTDRQVFKYRESFLVPEGGEPAESVKLEYSSTYNCGYEYNDETGMYKRFRVGEEHIERTSGEQLECANIIIQRVPNHTIEGDKEGRQELDNVGKGTGYYITCGKSVKIEWTRNSRTEPALYKDLNGNEIILNPGRTWVQIMPLYGEVIIE